jgi:outer membrane protein W
MSRAWRCSMRVGSGAVAMGLAAVVLALGAATAAAQGDTTVASRTTRVGSYLSYSWIPHAKNGWELGGEFDAGKLGTPVLHAVIEANWLQADVDRRDAAGAPIAGSFHDFSAGVALRYDFVHRDRLEPYAGVGVGVHFLGNGIRADTALQRAYRGTKVGGELFAGLAWDITRDGRWAAYVELRRVEVETVPRTTMRLGGFLRM